MKKCNLKNILSAALLLAGVSLVSCSDWTEVEGLKIDEPNIATQNPELYAKYLENLRTYKNSSHKVVYAWFDNSEKVPFNRAQHITSVPDSVDVIAMMHPDNLVERELFEMDQVRSNKGMKVVLSVSYDEIKLAYDNKAKVKSTSLKDGADDPFLKYLNDTLKHALSLADKYKYDGVIAGFMGKSTDHMTDAEKAVYTAYESAFIGAVSSWYQNNKSKILVFEGMPQYLTDKAILAGCKNIIIPCKDVDNEGQLAYRILMAKVDGVPSDRFVVSAQTMSLDTQDAKTGVWSDGTTRSVLAVASWAAGESDIAGMGIYNINNDYFNSEFIFKYARKAISILNPSIKK